MAIIEATCQGCGKAFETKSPYAKWCTATCRTKAKKREGKIPRTAGRTEIHIAPADLDAHPLVESTRRELERGGRLDTFSGELAMQLARKLAGAGDSGVSSLSKELRTVMAAAMEGQLPPSGHDEKPAAEEVDPVEKARRDRERARQAAVGS